jgi:hypothetical protein
MFDRFAEFQSRIEALLVRGEAVLRATDDRDVSQLGQTRWEMARLLREYQLYKHTRIFDHFERVGGSQAALARQMRAECIRVGEEFRAYILKWSVTSILDNWAEYQPAALDAIARIRAQLVREQVGVERLLMRNAA